MDSAQCREKMSKLITEETTGLAQLIQIGAEIRRKTAVMVGLGKSGAGGLGIEQYGHEMAADSDAKCTIDRQASPRRRQLHRRNRTASKSRGLNGSKA